MEPKNVEAEKEISAVGKKLELRKKMGSITLVTPPSFFTNQKLCKKQLCIFVRTQSNWSNPMSC